MTLLYDLIYLIFSLTFLPLYIVKRKFHREFWQRLGFLGKIQDLGHPVWIHAVSVGEAMAVKGLSEELRASLAGKNFVFSTVTPTGRKIVRSFAKENDLVLYLPLDFSFIVKSVINKINPSLFVIAETEIWPNLITCLHKKKIPIVIVNGRISDRSFKGYQRIKFLLKGILDKITVFAVQARIDAERLMRLGVDKEKICVTGNMKFDYQSYPSAVSGNLAYKTKLGLGEGESLFVAGSTHRPEEEMILRVYKKLFSEFPHLKLLLAPRHPERANDIEKIVIKEGFLPLKISTLGESTSQRVNESTVFILDTIGELLSFYALAELVFVGGSLVKKGGHNILEPASLGKPVLFGPHTFNFRDITELFLEEEAVILVEDEEALLSHLKDLLNHPQKMQELGEKAKAMVSQNQGATSKNARMIKEVFEKKNAKDAGISV